MLSVRGNNCVCYVIAMELRAFESVTKQLLMDVQERLVYRTYIYIKSDILQYAAAMGDLAYPEKLEMMEVKCHPCLSSKVNATATVFKKKLSYVVVIVVLLLFLIYEQILFMFSMRAYFSILKNCLTNTEKS